MTKVEKSSAPHVLEDGRVVVRVARSLHRHRAGDVAAFAPAEAKALVAAGKAEFVKPVGEPVEVAPVEAVEAVEAVEEPAPIVTEPVVAPAGPPPPPPAPVEG